MKRDISHSLKGQSDGEETRTIETKHHPTGHHYIREHFIQLKAALGMKREIVYKENSDGV